MTASDSMKTTEAPANSARGGVLASLGLTAGLGSVFASSCCVVPLTLGSLGAGASIFPMLEALAPYRWLLIAISAAVVAGAWTAYLRRPKPACESGTQCTVRRSRGIGVLLAAASLQLFIATLWTSIEPTLVRIIPWL